MIANKIPSIPLWFQLLRFESLTILHFPSFPIESKHNGLKMEIYTKKTPLNGIESRTQNRISNPFELYKYHSIRFLFPLCYLIFIVHYMQCNETLFIQLKFVQHLWHSRAFEIRRIFDHYR